MGVSTSPHFPHNEKTRERGFGDTGVRPAGLPLAASAGHEDPRSRDFQHRSPRRICTHLPITDFSKSLAILRAVYQTGPFTVDPDQRVLMRGADIVPLTPKVFDTLLVLVENAGRVLTRDFLMDHIWPDANVSDTSLSQNIWLLRKTLGDDDAYIETVPRRGYRFKAAVKRVTENEDRAPAAGDPVVPRPAVWNIALAASLIAAAILATTTFYFWRTRDTARTSRRQAIVAAPFVNTRGSADAAWLSAALPQMIADDLAAGDQLRVVPYEVSMRMTSDLGIRDTAQYSLATARKVGRYADSQLILSGSFVDVPGNARQNLLFTAYVQDVRSAETLATVSAIGSRDELLSLVRGAAADLRARLALTRTDDDARSARAMAPKNVGAARAYAEAMQRVRVSDLLGARDLLVGATQADPDYAMGYKSLSDVYWRLGYEKKAFAAASEAQKRAKSLPRVQQLEIDAAVARSARDYPKLIQTYEALWRFYPDNLLYAIELAQAYGLGKRPHDGLAILDRVDGLPEHHGDPEIDIARSTLHQRAAEWQAAADAARKAQETLGRVPRSPLLRARACVGEAQSLQRISHPTWRPKMERCLELARRTGDIANEVRALHNLGTTLDDEGHHEEGLRLIRLAAERAKVLGSVAFYSTSQSGIAFALEGAGRREEAIAAYGEAANAAREAGEPRMLASTLNNLGEAYMGSGDLVLARKNLEEALQMYRALHGQGDSAVLDNLGEIAIRAGDFRAADAFLTEAAAVGQKMDELQFAATAYRLRAAMQRIQGDPNAARASIARAEELLKDVDSETRPLVVKTELARVELAAGQHAAALRVIEAVLAKAIGEEMVEVRARALAVRAEILAVQGSRDEARATIAEAQRTATRMMEWHDLRSFDITSAMLNGDAAKLAAIAPEAVRRGDAEIAFQARLARCHVTRDAAQCAALAREAHAQGFALVASQANPR